MDAIYQEQATRGRARDPGEDAIALLREIVTTVRQAPEGRATLFADSLTVSVAQRIVDDAQFLRQRERNAVMALRDLVWRIDTAKFVLRDAAKSESSQQVAETLVDLLTTDDILAFLEGPSSDDSQLQAGHLPGEINESHG